MSLLLAIDPSTCAISPLAPIAFDGQTLSVKPPPSPVRLVHPGLLLDFNAAATSPPLPHSNSIQIVGADGQNPALYIDGFGLEGGELARSIINLRAARGTSAEPSATLASDEVARFSGRGHTGVSGFTGSMGAVSVIAAEDTTPTAQGALVAFRRAPLGTVALGSFENPPIGAALQPGGFTVGSQTFNLDRGNDLGEGWLNVEAGLAIEGVSCNGARNIILTASEDIPAFYAVTAAGSLPSITNLADGRGILGISVRAAVSGDKVELQPFGALTNLGWSWGAGTVIFAADGGALSASVPAGAWQRQMGTATGEASIAVVIGECYATP